MDIRNALIVSAHADDESFGMGGTLHYLKTLNTRIIWLIATRLWEPRWSAETISRRDIQIRNVADRYGIADVVHWDFQDNRLDTYPTDDKQEQMIAIMEKYRPDTIFTPGPWDFNFEHRMVFELVEMSAKPAYSTFTRQVIGYEIPSSTEWRLDGNATFSPTLYINIEPYLEQKIETCALYESEQHPFPHPRSRTYLEALSRKRGGESGLKAAEAFRIFRTIMP